MTLVTAGQGCWELAWVGVLAGQAAYRLPGECLSGSWRSYVWWLGWFLLVSRARGPGG